jgi:hypothetical protein
MTIPEQGWTVRLLQFRIEDEVEDPLIDEDTHIHWEALDTYVNEYLRKVTDDTQYVMILRDE